MRKCRNGWHKNWYDGVILWEPWIWCTKHRLLSFRNENRKFFTACRRTTYNKWEWLIIYTASKKRNLVYSIALYWQDFRSLNLHSNFVIFTKTLTKSCSSWLQASFDIFWVQIGQVLEAQWVFEHSEESPNRRHFLRKQRFIDVQAFFKSSLWLE